MTGTDDVVGRGPELRMLADLVDRVGSGRGGALLMSGEPGIGKSRLLRAVRALAMEDDLVVAGGHGWADEGAPPLWPWVQVLRVAAGRLTAPVDAGLGAADLARLVPELAPWLPAANSAGAGHEGFYLRDAAVSVLAAAAQHRPVLVCLDDLHWTDVASIRLASHLAGASPRHPIGLVVTWRDGEGGDEHAAALDELRQLTVPLALAGLDVDACGELAELRTGVSLDAEDRRILHERTGGNAFFVEDLATFGGVESGLPHRTRATLSARLDRLDGQTRHVLEVASVVGRAFRPSVVAAVADLSTEAVDGAMAVAASAGLVEPAPEGTLRFRHALLAEAVVSAIEPVRRAAHHVRCAEAAAHERAGRGASARDAAADTARHLLAALPHADRADARLAAVRAGREAADRRAHDDAAAWYRRALECLDAGPSDDVERTALLIERGRALLDGHGVDEAVGVFEAAEASAARAGDAVARVEALVWVTEARYRAPGLDLDERTRLLLEDAVGALDESQPVLTSRAAEQLARLEIMVGTGDRALAAADRAADIARSCGGADALAAARGAHRWALVGPYDLEEKAAASRALASTGFDDPAAAWHYHYWLLLDALERGDRRHLDGELAASRRLTEQLCEPFFVSLTKAWEVCLALIEGRFADAEAGSVDALAIMEAAGVDPAGVLAQTMYLARERGELADYEGLLSDLATAVPERSAVYRAILALVFADGGRTSEATAELTRLAADDFRGVPVNGHWLTAMMFCAEACALLDDVDAAASLRPLLLPYRDRTVVAGAGAYLFLGAVAHHCGSLAITLGRGQEAVDDLELARRMHRQLGARPWGARTDHEMSRALLLRGRPGDARAAATAWSDARRTATELCMAGLQAQLEHPTRPAIAAEAAMIREAGSWRITFSGQAFGLPDSKGLRCLAQLMAAPNTDFDVVELAQTALGESAGDVERTRVNVTRQLKAAIARVEDHHPQLGQHLQTAVRTGRRCAYRPAGTPPDWHVI